MIRKRIFVCLGVLLVSVCLFADAAYSDDYKAGYQDGYIDALSSRQNKFLPIVDDVSTESQWAKYYYVDDFGDATDEVYLTTKKAIYGTFTNSATQDSLLKIYPLIDETNSSFVLYEYEDSLVTGSSDYPGKYIILIRDEKGKDWSIGGSNFGDRVAIQSIKRDLFNNLLVTNKHLKVRITEQSNYYPSSYRFDIDTTGFKELYSALKK